MTTPGQSGASPEDGPPSGLPSASKSPEQSSRFRNITSSFHRRRHKGPPGTGQDNVSTKERDEESRLQAVGHVPRSDGGPWWRIRLFRGMVNDIRRRAPYYMSDWIDAWNYRVVPATVYMYFAKCVLPLFYLFIAHFVELSRFDKK